MGRSRSRGAGKPLTCAGGASWQLWPGPRLSSLLWQTFLRSNHAMKEEKTARETGSSVALQPFKARPRQRK
jgi:hypothetical protein